VAGLPNRQEKGWDHREWEPSGALLSALGEMSVVPGVDRNGELARLKPQLEEALSTLERLDRQRELSEREKARAGALGMLLASFERVK
jgi:hypothetical protein